MLVGWGIVCIRRTAQRSTGEFGSCPFEGSRHRTNRSLHKIPYSGRGVNSGAKQSTATLEASPWESNTSNAIVCLRTIRVIRSFPSIIKRLMMKQIWRVSKITVKKKICIKFCIILRTYAAEQAGSGTCPLSALATVPTSFGIQPRVSPHSYWWPEMKFRLLHDQGDHHKNPQGAVYTGTSPLTRFPPHNCQPLNFSINSKNKIGSYQKAIAWYSLDRQ